MTSLEPRPIPHPVTGEKLNLADESAGDLLHILDVLRERAAQFKAWTEAVEAELVSRGAEPGLYEIDRQMGREWDIEDLTATLHDLVMRDRLKLADIDGIIKQQPPKVDGTKALALLNKAEEDVLLDLRRCFTWKPRGRARVRTTVTEIEA